MAKKQSAATTKPPAKMKATPRPAKKRRPAEKISEEDLLVRAAMREAGGLDDDTDPMFDHLDDE